MRSAFLSSQIFAFLTVLMWASTYVFTRIVLEHFSIPAVAFLRCASASVVLAAALLHKRPAFPCPETIPRFLLVGAVGFALYMPVFNKASLMLNPTTGCVVIATSPVITALMARCLFKERLRPRQWLAIGLSFCGILIMTLWNGVLAVTAGVPWMLAAALCMSSYNLLQRGLSGRYGPLPATAFGFMTGALLLAPAVPESLSQALAAPPGQTLLVCFLGVFPGAAAYLLWAKALALAENTSAVTNYMFLTPFLTLMLDFVVTGSLPPPGTFAGGGVILLGLLLFASGRGGGE